MRQRYIFNFHLKWEDGYLFASHESSHSMLCKNLFPACKKTLGFCRRLLLQNKTVLSGVLGDRVISEEDAAADAGGRAADDQR